MLWKASLMPARKRPRGPSRQHRILILDPSSEPRDAAIGLLLKEGYELFVTGSVDAACALVRTGQPEVILINLSAFPALSLCKLSQALSQRRRIRVLGLVWQYRGDGPPVTQVLHLDSGEVVTFGFQYSYPN
jgi:hypothetical protein